MSHMWQNQWGAGYQSEKKIGKIQKSYDFVRWIQTNRMKTWEATGNSVHFSKGLYFKILLSRQVTRMWQWQSMKL